MTDLTTVEQLLRDHPPTPPDEPTRAAHKQRLRTLMTAEPATVSSPRRHRRWRGLGIGVLAGGLILGGAGAATAFLTWAQPDDPQIVRCFSVATAPFASGAPGSYEAGYGSPDGTLDTSAARAIELCGALWSEGRLPWPETKGPGYTANTPQPIPDLRACILPDGVVGVLPGGPDTCRALGLPTSAA